MFDPNELKSVLENHDRAFQLFLWINKRFREENPLFEKLTEEMMHAEPAARWMSKYAKSFPVKLAPTPATLQPMAQRKSLNG